VFDLDPDGVDDPITGGCEGMEGSTDGLDEPELPEARLVVGADSDEAG
jgi:hypothetical protein